MSSRISCKDATTSEVGEVLSLFFIDRAYNFRLVESITVNIYKCPELLGNAFISLISHPFGTELRLVT